MPVNSPFSPNSFQEVFHAELEEIAKRQSKTNASEVDPKELAGIALSGGGIRSATTSLGVLQALKKLGILPVFDYLSTVSGGGFTGSWWSAWTSRNFDPSTTPDEKFFPPAERTQPERDAMQEPEEPNRDSSWRALDPVHHLRLFSNYLTPMKGAFSADTWRANAVVSRNLAMTWLILVPLLFAAVLVAQAYFTVQPKAEMEYLYPYSHFAEDDEQAKDLSIELAAINRLDSVVHGGNSIIALKPVQSLRELKGPQVSSPDVQLDRDLQSLHAADSVVALKGGEQQFNPVLDAQLDTIVQGVAAWRAADVATRNNPSLPAAKKTEILDSTRNAYRAALDPKVDSAKYRIRRMQAKLVAHRTEVRDNLLFNDLHLKYLANRADWASILPIMMIGWIVMLVSLWMINSGHRLFGGNVMQGTYAFLGGLTAYLSLSWAVATALGTFNGEDLVFEGSLLTSIWSVVALLLLGLLLWDDTYRFWKRCRPAIRKGNLSAEARHELMKLQEVRRSRIVTYHQRILLAFAVTVLLLAFGAYGHEVINYLFFYRSGTSIDVWQWLGRIAGIATILGALTGTGLAARSARERNDRGEVKKSGKLKSTLIGIAPPLIVLLLLCGMSWLSHWVLQALVFKGGSTDDQDYLVLVFAMWLFGFLSLYYAVFDLHFRARRSQSRSKRQFSRVLLAALFLTQLVMMISIVFIPSAQYRFTNIRWLLLPVGMWMIVAWKYRWEQKNPQPVSSETSNSSDLLPSALSSSWISKSLSILQAGGTALLIVVISTVVIVFSTILVEGSHLPIDHIFLTELGASVFILLLDLLWGIRSPEEGRRGNHEPRILLGINVTLITLFLIIPPLAESQHWGVTHVLDILISLAIGSVIFLGWRIDPNALSIHEFYRNRIVRAYLGASNWMRGINKGSVSAEHPEDDIALTDLRNCESGAPYHLINTTLNLLGTKSLEAAQRHASNFIFSKRYCGSVTTGYRPTEEYMSSTMTLGTAVAISGAAASPNMGSNQVSGATTMLMSLLNVRLGYWAANPGQRRWREPQAKLWPYYLLKESLSQTSGFGAFCYLTDGGHFDNTGLYALIERACRFIVLCDNGADPNAHFKDLGNALRRCRIDFGVEFQLDGLKEMTSMGKGGSHWLRGTVRYCEEHVQMLWGNDWDKGLTAEERNTYLEGTILILKPSLVGDEPADVLQYGLEQTDFPQQSTANQWFTEDQFESYRRLGFWSTQMAFANTDYSEMTREEKLRAIRERPSEKKVLAPPIPDLAYGATSAPLAEAVS